MGVGNRNGYNIIEKDSNGDIICCWTYPSSTQQQKDLMMRKCRFEGLDSNFLYGRFGNSWYNIFFTECPEANKLPKVRQFAICIWSADFNPEKYEAFARAMSKNYIRNGDQVSVLNIYLSVISNGKYSGDSGEDTIVLNDFPQSQSLSQTNIKEIISNFGLETILIYTAVLLKKRIVIYHHNMSTLLKTVRSLPAFMSQRQTLLDTLYPCVDLHKDEIINLKSSTSYIAGCRDANVASSDLFDVFVHLPAREISIAPGARESMSMTRAHKEIAFFLVQLSQNEGLSEQQVVSSIVTKTSDLLEQVKCLATTQTPDGKFMVTLDSLRAKNLPHAMENFLLNLAVAEEIMML